MLSQKAKLDSALHLVEYFEFLGPLLEYNTSIYEADLHVSKSVGRRHGNNKPEQVCLTILTKVRVQRDLSLANPVSARNSRPFTHSPQVCCRRVWHKARRDINFIFVIPRLRCRKPLWRRDVWRNLRFAGRAHGQQGPRARSRTSALSGVRRCGLDGDLDQSNFSL